MPHHHDLASSSIGPAPHYPSHTFSSLNQRIKNEIASATGSNDAPCAATDNAGAPCRRPRQRYRPFRFAHNPENTGRRVAIAAAAGRASGVSRRTVPVGFDGLNLLSREGVASLLTQLLLHAHRPAPSGCGLAVAVLIDGAALRAGRFRPGGHLATEPPRCRRGPKGLG